MPNLGDRLGFSSRSSSAMACASVLPATKNFHALANSDDVSARPKISASLATRLVYWASEQRMASQRFSSIDEIPRFLLTSWQKMSLDMVPFLIRNQEGLKRRGVTVSRWVGHVVRLAINPRQIACRAILLAWYPARRRAEGPYLRKCPHYRSGSSTT